MPGGDYQLVPVPITPGMREDIHRNAAAPPGTLRYASNVRWGAMGAAERRNGTTELATTVDSGASYAVNSGLSLDVCSSSLGATIVGTDGIAFVLREAETGWRVCGSYSTAEPVRSLTSYADIGGAANASQSASVAVTSDGYRVHVYTSEVNGSYSANVIITDGSGNTVRASQQTARRARAVGVGTAVYICFENPSTRAIDVYRSTSGGAISSITSGLVTLDASDDSWDICPWTTTRWAFVHLDTSSTTATVRRMNAGTTEASVTQSTNMRATSRLSLYADTNHVWLGWSDNSVSNVARVSCWNWTGAALSAAFTSSTAWSWTATDQTGTPPIIGTGPSATQVRLIGALHNESSHASPDLYSWRHKLLDTSGTYTRDTTQFHGVPLSKPFGRNGEYAWADLRVRKTPLVTDQPACVALVRMRDVTATSSTLAVVDLVAHYDPEGVSYPVNDWWSMCPPTPEGSYLFAARRARVADNTGIYYSYLEFLTNSALERRSVTAALPQLAVSGQPCNVLSVLTDSGGTPAYGIEQGMHRGPTVLSAVASNGAGSLSPSSSYQYVAVYAWVGPDGALHRSAPSAPLAMSTGASDDTGTVSIATIDFERRFVEPGSIELYRTEAGKDTFHLIAQIYNANSFAIGGTTNYDVGYTDLASDASIQDNPILYTQSQQVAHDMAPACRFLRASESRLWAAGGWDPNLVQASKIFVPGEPVQWSSLDTFKVYLPRPCTGLAFQDGALLAFSSTSVYAIGTDGGPGNDGLQSFADPRLVCPGIGTEQAASILETPIGVIFRSRRGFELIPRGLGNVQSLPGIETTLETYPTIVSSTLHVDGRTTTAQFVARSSSNASLVLVFDLDKQAWSVDTYPVDVVQISTTADGRLLLASENTAVSPAFLVESSSATDDDGVFYQMKLTFHDIYPFGVFKMGSVHSVYARADAQGTCVLNVDIGVDGGSARNCPWTFSGATTFETYREQTPALDQSRGTSIQLSAYDTSSGDAASGVALYGFGLKVADKDSAALLTSAERQ